MRTIDFREFLASELQDPETRREFIIGYYELDGMKGIRAALEEIARADALAGIQPERTPTNSKEKSDLDLLWDDLKNLGLEFRLTRTGAK